jgi:hypothetical protein
MNNKYQVILWRRVNPYHIYLTPQTCGSYKSYNSAYKHAVKLNNKHCRETKYFANGRRNSFVEIYKPNKGVITELEPIIVPSVGELGYW